MTSWLGKQKVILRKDRGRNCYQAHPQRERTWSEIVYRGKKESGGKHSREKSVRKYKKRKKQVQKKNVLPGDETPEGEAKGRSRDQNGRGGGLHKKGRTGGQGERPPM